MSGKWSQIGVPHRGWTCVSVDDLTKCLHCAKCRVESAEGPPPDQLPTMRLLPMLSVIRAAAFCTDSRAR